jgi:glutaredoxin
MPGKELVMYSRRHSCPYVHIARRVLEDYQISYKEIFLDDDEVAMDNVLRWTGFLSVPTLVIAHSGEVLPYELPDPLPRGASPRGVNRGSMLTEPNRHQLIVWLEEHGFISGNR